MTIASRPSTIRCPLYRSMNSAGCNLPPGPNHSQKSLAKALARWNGRKLSGNLHAQDSYNTFKPHCEPSCLPYQVHDVKARGGNKEEHVCQCQSFYSHQGGALVDDDKYEGV